MSRYGEAPRELLLGDQFKLDVVCHVAGLETSLPLAQLIDAVHREREVVQADAGFAKAKPRTLEYQFALSSASATVKPK